MTHPLALIGTEICARLVRVLAFAQAHVEALEQHLRHWDDEKDRVIRLVDKVCTEGALLLLVAKRVAGDATELDEQCAQFASELIPRIRSQRLQELLIRSPQVSATLGAGHIFLAAAGYPEPFFDKLILQAVGDGFAETVERVPYRLIDQRWTRGLRASEVLSYDDLLPFSILATRAHPFYMTQSDAYAATHTVMYLTDFGQTPLPLGLNHDHVGAMVEAGLAWHVLSEDFDLLLEFLIDAVCLGLQASPYAVFAWRVVKHVWDGLGFLPGPTFDAGKYRDLKGEAAAAYAFQHLYHTNFVAGILCAVLMLQEDGDGTAECSAVQDGSTLERLLIHAFAVRGTKVCPTSAWVQVLSDAPVANSELLGVINDAVLIEAVRQCDWQRMECVLEEVWPLGLPETPTLQEARRLRCRLRDYRMLA